MESSEFKKIRSKLGKTQDKMAQLLGVSIKTVHSYEQGWRKIPFYIERQLLFLMSRTSLPGKTELTCWKMKDCKDVSCPAREYDTGDLCWFINGTWCAGLSHGSWDDKMNVCKNCEVFKASF